MSMKMLVRIDELEQRIVKLETLQDQINNLEALVERVAEIQRKKGGRPRNLDKYGVE